MKGNPMSEEHSTAPERYHFVHFVLESGDRPRAKFECRAPENSKCRVFCKTCWDESQEQCVCDYQEPPRKPNVVDVGECGMLPWLEHDPDELYDGPSVPIRGPEPAPVVLAWEGDYYTWEYAA